jgi:putative sigma-54 modulation protein
VAFAAGTPPPRRPHWPKHGRFGETSLPPATLSLDFVSDWLHHTHMNLILSTHNVTLTKAIEEHTINRIKKLEHLDRFAINARVTLEHDKTKAPERQFSCSMRLAVPGPDLFAEDVESDLYTAIDLVSKKIEQQIRKRHNKYKARKHKQAARGKRIRQEKDLGTD